MHIDIALKPLSKWAINYEDKKNEHPWAYNFVETRNSLAHTKKNCAKDYATISDPTLDTSSDPTP